MAQVKNILSEKDTKVISIDKHETVLAAAELMNRNKIGSLLVITDDHIDGIFTERDILSRVVAAKRDPAATKVEEVMTSELACCKPATSVEEARAFMRAKKVRHLPVIDDDGKLHGMISIGDLNAWHLESQEQTISYMQQYLYGNT